MASFEFQSRFSHTDGSAGFGPPPAGRLADPLPRHCALYFNKLDDSRFLLSLQVPSSPREGITLLRPAEIPLGVAEINEAAADCLTAWERVALGGGPAGAGGPGEPRPEWDFRGERRRPWLDRAVAALATAGGELFTRLFVDPAGKPDRPMRPADLANLAAIVNFLRHTASAQEWVISIYFPHEVQMPFGLICADPSKVIGRDGYDWRQFWGVRHVIEHCPDDLPPAPDLMLPGGERGVPAGFGHEPIDPPDLPQLDSHIEFWEGLGRDGRVVLRRLTGRGELETAIKQVPFEHRLLYLFCRGDGGLTRRGGVDPNPPGLWLDVPPLTINEFRRWLRGKRLESLLFVNACQAGQSRVPFRSDSFANLFLDHGALGLLAPLTRIPEGFAAEYAQRFFNLFLGVDPAAGLSSRHVGPVVRHLARWFLSEYDNPLGLLYILFRGAGCQAASRPRPATTLR